MNDIDTLNPAEVAAIIASVERGRGSQPIDLDHIRQAVTWAHNVRLAEGVLQLVIEGRVNLTIRGGEIAVARTEEGPSAA